MAPKTRLQVNPLDRDGARLETYTELKQLVENPYYQIQKKQNICDLTDDMIDPPIVKIINGFNKLPGCFTLQSCYGHFVSNEQQDPHNLDSLPIKDTATKVKYRIAYIAFCIQNSASGKKLFQALKKTALIDPENIQFCCADWFWKRQVNSYVLQVEPNRYKQNDTVLIDYNEALHIEKARNEFFLRLYELVEIHLKSEIG